MDIMSIIMKVRHIISCVEREIIMIMCDPSGKAGDVTFTPDGKGHGMKNIGDTDLVFMALINFD